MRSASLSTPLRLRQGGNRVRRRDRGQAVSISCPRSRGVHRRLLYSYVPYHNICNREADLGGPSKIRLDLARPFRLAGEVRCAGEKIRLQVDGVPDDIALKFARTFIQGKLHLRNDRISGVMSVIGTKRTSLSHSSMSAFGGKADIAQDERRSHPGIIFRSSTWAASFFLKRSTQRRLQNEWRTYWWRTRPNLPPH